MKLVALGGVLGPALFSAMVVICGALRPGYSHIEEFISALGAQGTTHAALMNYAGFVPSGVLIAVFGLSLLGVMPRGFLSLAVAVLVAITISSAVFRRVMALRSLWAYSAMSSVAALSFLVGLIVSLRSGGPVGLWQRLFLGTVFVWCAVVALRANRLIHNGV